MEIKAINKNKLSISNGESTIIIKFKHIPIFLMMVHNHFNPFASKEKFGGNEVVKNGKDTKVVKVGGNYPKYSIGNFVDGTRLYGMENDPYLEVTEEETSKLIKLLSNYFLENIGVK
jgi:hypothetical protein